MKMWQREKVESLRVKVFKNGFRTESFKVHRKNRDKETERKGSERLHDAVVD
jgi:hypothetical protein